MDVDRLVVGDGDQVVATGRLIRNDSGDWFQPSLPVAGPGGLERRVENVWGGAIRVTGADFGAVGVRFEKDGAVEGWATVTGTWSGGQLRAGRQDPWTPRITAHGRLVTPPCPPPEGGWPAAGTPGGMGLSFDPGDLSDTGAAVAMTLFRPGEGQVVLVVAAADVAAVEARLRPQLGGSLCVVPSRWTKDDLDGVRDYLHQRRRRWNIYRLGTRHAEDGHACVYALLVRVLPEVAAWAASVPPGIVSLEPWLVPAR